MPRPGLLSCALLLTFSACATATAAASPPPTLPTPPRAAPAEPADPSLRERVVERAASALGQLRLSTVTREVSDDCTGFVRWAYRASGEDLVEGSVGNMLSMASRARAL